jgi:Api92-like protein with ferredoxin domain
MPNWCENDLYITGPNVAAVLEAIAGQDGDDKTAFDFNKIVPMPEELNIESGTNTDFALDIARGDVSKWLAYPWAIEAGIVDAVGLCKRQEKSIDEMRALGARVLSNIKKHGAPTWYDWRIAHWGCKWNASDVTILRSATRTAKLTFNTAWSPPIPVIAALAARFPDNKFKLNYFERGCSFQGGSTYERGEEVEHWDGSYVGGRGG